MTSISFSDHNIGVQAGVVNGDVNTAHSTEHINTIRPLTKSLYKSLFSSSELFSQIRNELGLLVSVLGATQGHIHKANTDNEELPGLADALNNCHHVLNDLLRLKEHFDSVGAQTQGTWERMGWAEEQLKDIRSKFVLCINVLNSLNTNMIRSSHENIERMLKTFIDELRSGKRESSAMSALSTGSLSQDGKEEWRQLRKELESICFTPGIFARNRDVILNTLRALSQDDCPPGARPEDDMTPLSQIRNQVPVDPASAWSHTPSNEAFSNEYPNVGAYHLFRFHKADPPPGGKAQWKRAERTEIRLAQRSLREMVRRRAHEFSAAQQYQNLSYVRRAHVNQLIHELRGIYTTFAWSCAYAKEHDRVVQGSSTHYECTAIDVIIMGIGHEEIGRDHP